MKGLHSRCNLLSSQKLTISPSFKTLLRKRCIQSSSIEKTGESKRPMSEEERKRKYQELIQKNLKEAAEALKSATAILITAGAGMGVDSGLPDFRGPLGFWEAYPALKAKGFTFPEMAQPVSFSKHPQLAWGFYGHRLSLYRKTVPHEGFSILKDLGMRLPMGSFVFTSNVDGQAGFGEDAIEECHGSIHYLQCLKPSQCEFMEKISKAPNAKKTVVQSETEMEEIQREEEAKSPLVRMISKEEKKRNESQGLENENVKVVELDVNEQECTIPKDQLPTCKAGRPNVLLFGDYDWVSDRTDAQEELFNKWRNGLRPKSTVVVDIGSGRTVPTVRLTSELIARQLDGTLIRINPREPHIPAGIRGIPIPMGALNALKRIKELIGEEWYSNHPLLTDEYLEKLEQRYEELEPQDLTMEDAVDILK